MVLVVEEYKMAWTWTVKIMIFVVITIVDGFRSYCDVNNTLIVTEGNNATFVINFDWQERLLIRYFVRYRADSRSSDILYQGYISNSGSKAVLSDEWEWRLFPRNFERNDSISLDVINIRTEDNGTYVLQTRLTTYCWAVFVLELTQTPAVSVEENRPVNIYAIPRQSHVVNASMVWLLDGVLSNVSSDFVVQDGMMRIEHAHRHMNGKVVTYRAIQKSGGTIEVNQTLNITYGPNLPLILSPTNTFYSLVDDEVLPRIACDIDCNPPCRIHWINHSNSNVLSLGRVSRNSTGEYVCTASRPGSSVVVNRSVYINVVDKKEWLSNNQQTGNPAFTTSIVTLATIQTVVILCFVAFSVWVWIRINGSNNQCMTWLSSIRKPVKTTKTEPVLKTSTDKDAEHYAPLSSNSRSAPVRNTYEAMESSGIKGSKTKSRATEPKSDDVYENM